MLSKTDFKFGDGKLFNSLKSVAITAKTGHKNSKNCNSCY